MFGLLPVLTLTDPEKSFDVLATDLCSATDADEMCKSLQLLNKRIMLLEAKVLDGFVFPKIEGDILKKLAANIDSIEKHTDLRRQVIIFQNLWLGKLLRLRSRKFCSTSADHVKLFNTLLEKYRDYLTRNNKPYDEDSEGNIWRSLFMWSDANLLSLNLLVYFASTYPDKFGDMVYKHRRLDAIHDYVLPTTASAIVHMLLEIFPPLPLTTPHTTITDDVIYRIILNDSKVFEELFCISLQLFHIFWQTIKHANASRRLVTVVDKVKQKIMSSIGEINTQHLTIDGALSNLRSLVSEEEWSRSMEPFRMPSKTECIFALSPARTNEPHIVGERIEAILYLEHILDNEKPGLPDTSHSSDEVKDSASTNNNTSETQATEDAVGSQNKRRRSSRVKEKRIVPKRKTVEFLEDPPVDEYGWGSLKQSVIKNLVEMMFNTSTYDDFSLYLPHLLGDNAPLFKATLRFLHIYIQKNPKRGIVDVDKAIRFLCAMQDTAPYSRFVEYLRLNNNNIVNQTLHILLKAAELDGTLLDKLMSEVLENLKHYLGLTNFATLKYHAESDALTTNLINLQLYLINRLLSLRQRKLSHNKKDDRELMLAFWRACFPDEPFNVPSNDSIKSRQWLFFTFESEDPLTQFQDALAPSLCIYFGKHHKADFLEIVSQRVYQRPKDYNFVKGLLDVTFAFVSCVLEPLLQYQEIVAMLFQSNCILEELFCAHLKAFDALWSIRAKPDSAEERKEVASITAWIVRALLFSERSIDAVWKRALSEVTRPNPGEGLKDPLTPDRNRSDAITLPMSPRQGTKMITCATTMGNLGSPLEIQRSVSTLVSPSVETKHRIKSAEKPQQPKRSKSMGRKETARSLTLHSTPKSSQDIDDGGIPKEEELEAKK